MTDLQEYYLAAERQRQMVERINDSCLDVIESMERLEEENEKLYELVSKYVAYTSQDRCEGCVYKSRCNDGEVDECWQRTEIRELARELGIEVE